MTSSHPQHWATLGSSKTVPDSDVPVVYVDILDEDVESGSGYRNHPLFENSASPDTVDDRETSEATISTAAEVLNSSTQRRNSNSGNTSSRVGNGVVEGSSNRHSCFLNTTIFFDQFKNKRIDVMQRSPLPTRPAPAAPSPMRPEPPLEDGFTLSPLALSHPAPPPYSEVAPSGGVTQQVPTVTHNTVNFVPPPRPPGAPRRKVLKCQHCGLRVHTVVLKQSGFATHLIALSFLFFCLFPITLLIYCTNVLKYNNHYCQFCNKLIGYEFPCLCQKLVYVDPDP